MNLSQIALQLYTLRDFLRTPAEIRRALAKVRAIGYEAVEAAGLGAIEDAELSRLLADEGLKLCATHESSDDLRKNPARVAEKLGRLGCRYAVFSYPANVDWKKPAQVENLVADLDRAGAILRAAGHALAYHNHGIEFTPLAGGTGLDYIFAMTGAQNLQAELDTYWVQHGGADPVDWCLRLKGRLPLLHLKDYTMTPEGKPASAPVGAGNLNWPAILGAAREAGCQWFVVEDESSADPFDSARQSFDFLRTKLTDG
jgi:sugar phosphate isomerase/epimerase